MSRERSPLILVVDDDPLQRTLVRAALEPFGFDCEEAEDGNVGIAKCAALVPDLVVLDVMMPARDGFSVCLEIRQKSKIETTPVLMMTALDDLKSIQRAYESGATNFQTKPINPQLLPYHIKYILRSSSFEKDILRAQRLAEEASAAKSQFLANMSHELRTPLNAVLGFSEVIFRQMLGELGNAKYLEYAQDIHSSAAHLLNIVNDILDVSKIESGEFKPNVELCDLREIIDRVVHITRPLAAKAGLRFEVSLAANIPQISTDKVRLKQVLINLISNAIKFTPSEGRITLSAEQTTDNGIVITVSDSGIGIPPDQIDKVLAPFGQVDSDLNRKYEGSGLGLPLAKTLTEKLGGTFLFQSWEGQGTRAALVFSKDTLADKSRLNAHKLAG